MRLTRVLDGRWLIEHDGTLMIVRDEELDEIALAASFRLRIVGVIPTGSGVGLELRSVSGADPNPDRIHHLHLCYSDEAEATAHAVLAASKLDHETGQVKEAADTGRHHLRGVA